MGKIFILTPRHPCYTLWGLFNWQHLKNYRTGKTNVALAPPFPSAPSFDSHKRLLIPRPLKICEGFLLLIKTTQLPCAPRLPKATCVHVSQTGSLTLHEASPLHTLPIQKDPLPLCLNPHLTPCLLSYPSSSRSSLIQPKSHLPASIFQPCTQRTCHLELQVLSDRMPLSLRYRTTSA